MAVRKDQVLNFAARMITTSLAVMFSAYLLTGVHINNILTALLLSLVLALLNMLIKPILILLTLPVTIATLGLFLLVINALIIMLAADMVPGFSVDGFWWALLFSVILSLVVSVLESLRRAG